MAETLSLLDFLKELINNVQLRDWFAEDPQAAMEEYGLKDLSPEDVRDAIVLADDSQTADFSRDYGLGGHRDFGGDHGGKDDDHDGGHQEAVDHLTRYVTNNFHDARTTVVDNSTNQQVDTHGGDFDQELDVHSTVASGDGAVAAGGDIEDSTVTTGDDNQIGDGNIKGDHNVQGEGNQVVNGDHNTTAFGSGSANSADIDDVNVSDGGALSVGGSASAAQSHVDSHNETTTTTETTFDDSFNTDQDIATDSFNETHTEATADSHDETEVNFLSHNHGFLPEA